MRNPFAALGARRAHDDDRQWHGGGGHIWGGANTGRLYSDWDAWTLSPDYEVRFQFRLLRARARQLVRDNPWIAGFQDECANNIVGAQGVMLQAIVKNAKGDLATATNQAIEAGWEEWGYPESASADGHDSLIELQRLAVQTMVTDGECLIRRMRGFDNPFGYALQIIDVDLLDELYNVPRGEKQNQIKMGVEVDANNRPVAYHIWTRYSEDMSGIPRERQRIDASEILHLFIRYRPNQTRGVSWLAPILTSVRHLDGYEHSELVAARISAAKMGFIKNTSAEAIGAFDPKPGEEMKTMEVAPGMIPELLPGQEFQEFNPDHPSTAYEMFTSTVLRAIARGLRVSYLTLTGDLRQANYSSMRAGLQPERDRWRGLHVWFSMHVLRPIYRDWIDIAVLKGAVAVDSRLGSRYYAVQFKGRGWKWVDPFNDLKAAKLSIDLGLDSRTRLAAEGGRDFENVVEELAYESDVAEEAGIDISGNQITGVNPTTVSNEGKADEEDAPADGSGDGDPAKNNPAQQQQARRQRRVRRHLRAIS